MDVIAKIDISNLTKLIKNKEILSNINLQVDNNEICTLIGPNGVGKTTLIKCLMGLIHINTGSITIDGLSVNRDNINQILPKMGAVLKFPESIAKVPVKRLFNQEMHYMRVNSKHPVEHYLNEVKLNIDPNVQAGELSLGMKQRLLLALAISHDPSLIILDEPFNGLDIEGIELIKNILINFTRKPGKSVLITSHTLDELNDLVDSVAFIDKGTMVPKKTMDDINLNYDGSIKEYYKKAKHNEY